MCSLSPCETYRTLKGRGNIWLGDEALDESWAYIPSHSTRVQIPILSLIHFNHYPEESEQLKKSEYFMVKCGFKYYFQS